MDAEHERAEFLCLHALSTSFCGSWRRKVFGKFDLVIVVIVAVAIEFKETNRNNVRHSSPALSFRTGKGNIPEHGDVVLCKIGKRCRDRGDSFLFCSSCDDVFLEEEFFANGHQNHGPEGSEMSSSLKRKAAALCTTSEDSNNDPTTKKLKCSDSITISNDDGQSSISMTDEDDGQKQSSSSSTSSQPAQPQQQQLPTLQQVQAFYSWYIDFVHGVEERRAAGINRIPRSVSKTRLSGGTRLVRHQALELHS